MENNDLSNDINAVSMQMILHAGDGRGLLEEAMHEIMKFKFEEAGKKINKAEEAIKKAHVCQTNVMQSQIRGDIYEYSILFTHAQDTLMTINSELRLIKQMFENQKAIDQRFLELENKIKGD